MRLIKNRQHPVLNLPTLRLEGGLFLPDQLEKAALGKASLQGEADYRIPKGLKQKDEYSRAFQIACAQWKHFAATLERQDRDAWQETCRFVQELLRDALGYHALTSVNGLLLAERHYPFSLQFAANLPIIIAPHTLALDTPDTRFAVTGAGQRSKSAFQLAQELLNASPDFQWALVSNGKQLRLLRDAASLTRPSYLEFDLQDMLASQRFAEFEMAWRLLHASRAGQKGETAHGSAVVVATQATQASQTARTDPCIWEIWRNEGQQEGSRVREGLREGVKQALLLLGNGFLQHPANDSLRRDLLEGRLSKDAYFQQLLRLVYRFIFLFTVEERGILHLEDDSAAAHAARRAYAEGYALARLRQRALQRRARNQFDDLWMSVRIVFRALAQGEARLALPALGGLFAPSQCPQLDAQSLTNASLLEVMRHLRWFSQSGSLAPVDYANMGPEELGSVYESLLELVPEIDMPARRFGFVGMATGAGSGIPGDESSTNETSTKGNARKTSGSYYTPDSLVQELIKSALDPVINARLAANPANPVEALLAIKVIDPACGSGHFLLAAARRLAERLASLRAEDGAIKPQDYRHALHEVIARCIFGVDRNPMALELARTALWLEGFASGLPLSFLNHHLLCGDALIGLSDLQQLRYGIPDAAFKPLAGDDRNLCKELAKANKAGLKAFAQAPKQLSLALEQEAGLATLQAIEAMPDTATAEVQAKEAAYEAFLQHARTSRLARAADLLVGAFLLPKPEGSVAEHLPNSSNLYLELFSEQGDVAPRERERIALQAAQQVCAAERVLHWPLAFVQVFARGGFDCVLANPPWERIKLQEEEFFASRNSMIAAAKNKAERGYRIDWLSQGMLARHLYPEQGHPPEEAAQEKALYAEFISARRSAEAASMLAHLKQEQGGRYPLTGVGDVNTYALFAETISQIVAKNGRAGFIVPTGIATDDSTKAYFAHIVQSGQLASLYDFENRDAIFPSVHRSYKFSLVTLGQAEQAEFAFFLAQPEQLADSRRRFALSADDFKRINPNTLTCPIFRSHKDAELTREIYARVPVLIREAQGSEPECNPWGISFMRMFDMATDSHLFKNKPACDCLPLYEAKMIHLFDHRWASYSVADGKDVVANVPLASKQDAAFGLTPRYWLKTAEIEQRLTDKGWSRPWLMGWRDITNATNERTVVASVLPCVATADTLLVMMPDPKHGPRLAGLLADQCALVHDFIARQKVGGVHLKYHVKKQITTLPPEAYDEAALAFIVPRVLELTYTANEMKPWAQDLGFDGAPFAFDPERRAQIRAELDAWYARAYGLSRDDLHYVLDPAEVMGAEYPSETFRGLKKNEEREFEGVFRTAKLILLEFDRMEIANALGKPYESLLVPQPGTVAESSYSTMGIPQDKDEGLLIGLIMIMLRNAKSLPFAHLGFILKYGWQRLANANTPESDDGKEFLQYCDSHRALFEPSRTERLSKFVRLLASEKILRQDGGSLVWLGNPKVPTGIVLDSAGEAIAPVLLRLIQEKTTVADVNQDGQILAKQA